MLRISRLVLVAPLLLAAAPPPSEVALRVELHAEAASSPFAVRLRAVPLGATDESHWAADGIEIDATTPGVVTIPLAPERTWRVEALAPGYWSPAQLVVLPVAGARLSITLWPTGRIVGTLRPKPEETLPSEITVSAEAAPGQKKRGSEFKGVCPLSEGRFNCEVPAGLLDLSLRARGFVSHYRWGLEVAPGADTQLGTLELTAGASVAGWVRTAQPPPVNRSCAVELAPVAAGPPATEQDEQRAERLRQKTTTDERGFFHFEGVEPGAYVVTATQAGFVPSSDRLQVVARAESRLRFPLTLEPPGRLELRLEPALDPRGEAWRVQLFTEGQTPGRLRNVLSAPGAALDGHWSRQGLASGRYQLQVLDSSGSSFVFQEIEVESKGSLIQIELPVLEVEGTVRLGESPLRATLFFGGQFGAQRIALESDEEGYFHGFLPTKGEAATGEWRVDVRAEAPSVFRRLRRVRPETSADGRQARLALKLPATHLAGVVVNEQGTPLSGANVSALGLEPVDLGPTVSTDPEGTFVLEGLEPGRYQLLAEQASLESDPLVVEVSAKTPVSSIELVLRPKRNAAGVVVSATGPVPGALVRLLPTVGGRVVEGSALPTGTTHHEGAFSLRASPWADGGWLTVMAPGFSLATVSVPQLPVSDLVVPLRQDGGTLVLALPKALELRDWEQPEPLVLSADGSLLTARTLLQWAALQGVPQAEASSLIVPAVEPGEYQACWFDRVMPLELAKASVSPKFCVSGVLTTGGELRLKLP